VAVAGNKKAVQVTVGPNLTFPTTLVGTTSATQLVTVSNTSVPAIPVSGGFIISGAGYARSTTTPGTCPTTGTFSLAAAGSCTIGVTFSPTVPGSATGALTITSAGFSIGGSPVLLTGTATQPAVATPTPNPLVIHRTTNLLLTTTGTGTATLTNTAPLGSQSFTVNNVTVSGTGFTIALPSNNCAGAVLAPGGSCTVQVRATASGTTTQSGTLTFTDTAPGGTHSIALQGVRP